MDLRPALLGWYDAHRRMLPWRGLPGEAVDPYRVWVSEMMLQQTRVETVLGHFDRWMRRFPTVRSLAKAGEEDVLAAWSGLGYYRRARALHEAARIVVEAHDGRLPDDAQGLARLPGIGPYASGAIASIAFGRQEPAVDGNVVRVLARLDGVTDVARGPVRKAIDARARDLVPADRPGDWNQALMDLGATVCTPRRPRCDACPLAAACIARRRGLQDRIPAQAPKRPPRAETVRFAVVEHEDHVLFVRGGKGLLEGLWRLPGGSPDQPLEEQVAAQTGVRVRVGPLAGTATHRFTHRTWEMQVHAAVPEPPLPGLPAPGARDPHDTPVRWLPRDGLDTAALSTAMRRALAAGANP